VTDAQGWIDEALRRRCLDQRRASVRDRLRDASLDGLVAYGNGRHSFLASNPAWYLTGLRQIGPHMALILPVEGDPVLIATPVWDKRRIGERIGAIELVLVEPAEFLDTVRDQLDRRSLRSRRFAIAGGVQPRLISEAWSEIFATPPQSGDRLVSDIAKVRDDWSLACVRRGADIAECGWANGLRAAKPGMAEYELAAEMEADMRAMGAEDNFQLLSASQHNRAAHRASNRILSEGDVLLGEVTPSVEGEYVQICRTAVFGSPTKRQFETFALLDRALRTAMAAARPGVLARDIVHIMNEPIIAAGYKAYTRPPFMRTRGHSMALGSMDPEIAVDSDQVLVEGMVFVLHPNQYFPDTGYMMCGEPVLITSSGAEPLTRRMGTLSTIPVCTDPA
jgi:Xaa-Pro dipeptidase